MGPIQKSAIIQKPKLMRGVAYFEE